MTERISNKVINPEVVKLLLNISGYLKKSGLDLKLLELVSYRVSQINGCAYCLDMHHKEALAMGEEELRLHSLPAWRECPYYTDKERAVLAFAEAVTKAGNEQLEDSLFEQLNSFYTRSEIADLTLSIAMTNTWNRLNKVRRPVPGKYIVGMYD